MQISTRVGVVHAIDGSSLEFLNGNKIERGEPPHNHSRTPPPPASVRSLPGCARGRTRAWVVLAWGDAPRCERPAAACALARLRNPGFPPWVSRIRTLISKNPAAAARYIRARAAGGNSRRSAGAILPECAARAAR